MVKQSFILTVVSVCFLGCVHQKDNDFLGLRPDPLADPNYVKQTLIIRKPSAIEFWVRSPRRHNYLWNIVRIWFPEHASISDVNGKKLWDFAMYKEPGTWQYTQNGLRAECDIPIGGKFIRTVKSAGKKINDSDTLELTMSFRNDSNVTWANIKGTSCLQLSATHDYEDNIGNRTYWVLDNVPTATYEMAITNPGWRGSSGVGKKVKMKDGTIRTLTECVTFVVSKDKKYVLGYSWQLPKQPGGHLFYNRAGLVACIHTDQPSFEVLPGQTKTVKGILFIHEGSIEEAYEKFLKWKSGL